MSTDAPRPWNADDRETARLWGRTVSDQNIAGYEAALAEAVRLLKIVEDRGPTLDELYAVGRFLTRYALPEENGC